LPAEADGLVEVGARVRFRHPLMRAAAYRAAPLRDCQKVHRALAEATDPTRDPDRRAWHRAQATPAPDEDVAQELERSAARAQKRGGMAAAAAFLERSAALTLEPTRRATRSLDAAEAKHLAGASDVALELLVTTELGPLDELQSARVDLMRGQIAFASSSGRDAPLLLLNAAKKLETLDVRLARETYLDALSAAIFVGRLAGEVSALEVATAVRAAPPASEPGRAADLLLDGMAALITDGYGAGRPILDRALRAFLADESSRVQGIRWLWLACRAAHDLWDDRTWEALCTSQLELARYSGALALLPIPLTQRIGEHLLAGEFAAAVSMIEEVEVVSETTGNRLPPYGAAALAAWEGRADASQQIDACVREVSLRGEGMGLSLLHYTKAVLNNGLCRYDEALAAAQLACDYPTEPGFYNWGLVELVEAASRNNQPRLASDAFRRLSETTRGGTTAWGQGIEARSRALVSDGAAADALYREAIERLAQCNIRLHLGRARLIYGEWLRRENRRSDARKQLHAAHTMFADIGAQPFAERARRELVATGERVRGRALQTRDDLTAQEAQIARLAGVGHTNPEIGAQLFISPKTVEWHLHKVFTKLGISSRRELRDAFPVVTGAVTSA
jgi:DNA-binding CsgD family transcriptional regulator